ncbi:MAG: UbiD family decarboxylase [Streptosporangiales bacterium]|nr:UbiD family decarboxylase [Streptosporangiales bacterium]
MSGYPDLHEHVRQLEEAGYLIRVERAIDKNTELHPLVRWQFCGGLDAEQRRAFLFENVVDAQGRTYDMPVLVGALASNRAIYALSMGCPVEDVAATWAKAISSPIEPKLVEDAPCHEVVIEGDDLQENGLNALPVPISTPGWDNGPYLTSAHYITRDPDTGVQNSGNYRGQIKSPTCVGMNASHELNQGITGHWERARAKGEPLPCAIVVGAPPCVTLTAVQKVPMGVDENAVSGGLVGEPLRVVRGRTVDVLVPAEAEIVIEGYISTELLDPEAPFGESHGHVNLQEFNAYMDVTAITRRRDAIFPSILSQVTPSESSLIKRVAYEERFLTTLREIGIHGLKRVFLHEPLTNIRKFVVLVFERGAEETNVWRALYAASSLQNAVGKFTIAVDDDIDPDNTDAILWALAYRMDPRRDMQVLEHRSWGHGPAGPVGDGQDAAVLMDATLKRAYPPISLPKREYMERAKEIWEELGLPKLQPQAPWFGYSLGDWSDEFEAEAQLAVRGEFWETGKKNAARRRGDIPMNTPAVEVDGGPGGA